MKLLYVMPVESDDDRPQSIIQMEVNNNLIFVHLYKFHKEYNRFVRVPFNQPSAPHLPTQMTCDV